MDQWPPASGWQASPPAERPADSDPWVTWLNAAPAGAAEPPRRRRRLNAGAVALLLLGLLFWGAVVWVAIGLFG